MLFEMFPRESDETKEGRFRAVSVFTVEPAPAAVPLSVWLLVDDGKSGPDNDMVSPIHLLPDEARSLARALMEAADAVEKGGADMTWLRRPARPPRDDAAEMRAAVYEGRQIQHRIVWGSDPDPEEVAEARRMRLAIVRSLLQAGADPERAPALAAAIEAYVSGKEQT